MTQERLADKVHEMVWSLAAVDIPFDNSDNFRDLLGLDTLDMVELVMLIELEWSHCHLSDAAVEKMLSVDDIVAFLEKNGVK